jgi:DNA-nicking Smr family endonuclease
VTARRRSLSRDEARLWAALAQTVQPFADAKESPPLGEVAARSAEGGGKQHSPGPRPLRPAFGSPPPPKGENRRLKAPPLDSQTLDASWERKLAKALVAPDFTLDLHGHSLEAAHRRLDMGLGQAIAMGARLVLLITGRPRPAEAADRGNNRGAIRAKVLDWLALGPHASRIAAVRGAHRRHGGAGALYVVLRRPR